MSDQRGKENPLGNKGQHPEQKDRAQRLGNQVRDSIRAAANFLKECLGASSQRPRARTRRRRNLSELWVNAGRSGERGS